MAAGWRYCLAGAAITVALVLLPLFHSRLPSSPSHRPAFTAAQNKRGGLGQGHPHAVNVAQHNRVGFLDTDPNFHVLEERKKFLRQRCAERKEDPIPIAEVVQQILQTKVPSILVNDKYKVLYCRIHKCCTTNMGKFFHMLATNKSTATASIRLGLGRPCIGVTWLHDLSAAEIKQRLLTYTKLVVVRNPLERVISGYRTGKVVHHNASFPAFIDWLNAQTEVRNIHYMFYTKRCLPCSIKYDLILDVDNLLQDIETTKAHLQIEKDFIFSERNISGYPESRSRDVYETYVRQLNSTQLKTFWKVNYDDYILFGYENPTRRRQP